ncbi:hypothetical protein BRD00_10025 [Halobacteriales archaeon QS_8_69_26]|nr:MAG: hypothetical protein BRD00_10025 [Halobacteriales archaeon QS_8_69_26]
MAEEERDLEWGVTEDASGSERVGGPGDDGSDAGSGGLLPLVAKLLGALVGATIGGAALGYVGYVAFVVGDTSGAGGLAFILGFIFAVFAIVAPFALGKFLGKRIGGRIAGDLIYGSTFVLSGAFVVALLFGGLYAIQVLGIDETFAAFVVFDAVTGVTAGGMGGYSLVEGFFDSRGTTQLAE